MTLKRGKDPVDEDNWTARQAEIYDEKIRAALGDRPEEVLGSARLFETLRRDLKDSRRDLMIFIHGFAGTFAGTAIRAAQVRHLYGLNGSEPVTVFFSWPANGEIFPSSHYFSDREDAEMSGIAMARALKKLLDFLEDLRRQDNETLLDARRRNDVSRLDELRECRRKIHVVAHSMGNWALRHAVQKLREFENFRHLPRIFDNVFLMAADADADALHEQHKLAPLLELANMVHVYHARGDLALQISDRTKGNPDRLGADGPSGIDSLDPRIIAIDCTDVSETVPSHGRHQYYRIRPEVIEDVRLSLRDQLQDGRKGRVAIRPGRSWRLTEARR